MKMVELDGLNEFCCVDLYGERNVRSGCQSTRSCDGERIDDGNA